MAFSKITNTQLNSRGATTLPDQPTISATALKQEFDAPAKNVVAPAVNNLIDELEAVTSAASLGAQAPTGRTGQTVQAVMNSISSAIDEKSTITITPLVTSGVKIATAVVDGFTKDLYAPEGGHGTMDYDDLTDKPQINSTTLSGNKSSSDLGLAAASHTHSASDITSGLAAVATSNSYNDLDNKPSIPTVTDTYSGTSSDAMSGKAVKSAIDALDGTITGSPSTSKTLSAFSQTDGKVSATFSDISISKSQVNDLASETAASGGTTTSLVTTGEKFNWNEKTKVAWSQDITTGQKIATITIDGTDTDVYAPTSGGGGGGGAVDSVNGQTGTVTLNLSNINDVTISSASNGQAVVYDSSTSKWKNQTLSIPNVTDTYSGTSSDAMSGKAVKAALQTLDGVITGSAGSGKTLTSFSETDGKVTATFGNISITKSQVSDLGTIPTVTDTYSGTSSDAMSGKAVKQAIDALDVTTSGAAASKTITALSQTDGKISATFGNISITKSQVSDFPTIPANLNDLSDVTVSSPSNDQVLKYNGSGWVNGAAPASGHTMLPTPAAGVDEDDVVDAINTGLLEGGANDDVASLYGVGSWSNTDSISLMSTVAQGTTEVGEWNDDWESEVTPQRSGWLWSKDLYQVLEDGDGNDVLDIELEPIFVTKKNETVGLYAWRIDDDYTVDGEHGGCIAFKFTGEIQSSYGAVIGVKVIHQRTKVKNFTVLA